MNSTEERDDQMKRFGIVSYNIYCNFTNYGSALQSWALHQAINRLGNGRWKSVLVDYCPDILRDKDPLNPFANMWDKDEESRRMCELTLPAIRENYVKFDRFYREAFERTVDKYTSENFNDIVCNEQLDGFVCGSDTIFCLDEFSGFEDGYFANYDCMKGKSVSYAASFGDTKISEHDYHTLRERIQNFKAVGLREKKLCSCVQEYTEAPVSRTIDPTLLLEPENYDSITEKRLEQEQYLLLYARRYNPEMEAYAERIAKKYGWKIIEISLRATNSEKGHRMFYEAGVEEYLSLVKYAEYVVTNSFHGLMFSVQFRKEFAVFSRESGDSKIFEALDLFGLSNHLLTVGATDKIIVGDYDMVHHRIRKAREESLDFLSMELSLLV